MSQVLTAEIIKEMSIEDLQQLDWNMIEAAKGFVLPPEGSYIFDVTDARIGTVGNNENSKTAVLIDLSIKQTVELVNSEVDVPVAEGTEVQLAYTSAQSLTFMKRDWSAVSAATSPANLEDFLNKLKGLVVTGILSHRAGTGDKKYISVTDIDLV